MKIKVIDQRLCAKSALKMLALVLVASLLASAQCIPLDAPEKNESPLQAEQPKGEETKLPEKAPEDLKVPEISPNPVPESGPALPEDIGPLSDDNPAVGQPDKSDLDTDSTFWGWGYRRPYYGGWRSYYSSPWRRWGYGNYGYGRGFGGWGWGRGWGWRGGYW
uniref:Uncharacterized protein n=1 Tax=Photinus pyralis TaxID=7054 RepID=A0A1Y1L0X1_PHOPY